MRHATGLQHPDTTVAFAVAFNTAQENPGIHQRRNADLRLLEGTSSLREAGKKSSNLVRLEKIYQAGQHRLNFQRISQRDVTSNRIDDYNSRLGLGNKFMHPQQMHFQSMKRGAGRIEPNQPFFDPWTEVDADGKHIPHDQIRTFFRGKVDAVLAPATGGIDKVRSQARFSGSGRARNQNTRATKISLAAQHGIQARYAARNSVGRGFVL